MERGKLRPEQEKCIQEKYLIIKDNIANVQDITAYLSRKKIITPDDKERILLEKTICDKNQALLKAVLNGGPNFAFHAFCKALRKYSTKLWEEVGENFQCYMSTKNCGSDCTLKCQSLKNEKDKAYFNVTLLRISLDANETDDDKTFRQGDDLEKALMENSGRVVNIVDYLHVGTENMRKLVRDAELSLNDGSTGFHAILLVTKYKNTRDYSAYKILDTLKGIYGSEILKYYGIFLVTYNNEDEENQISVEEWLKTQNDKTKLYLKECGNRIILVSTKIFDKIIHKDQMDSLIRAIDNLQFNGRRYTFKEFEKAEDGRRQLLLQEREPQITEETYKKCFQMIKDSEKLQGDKIKNCKELLTKAAYERDKLMKEDNGTNILSSALKQVDETIEILGKTHKRWVEINDAKSECQAMQKHQEIQLKHKLEHIQKINKQKNILKESLKQTEEESRLLEQKIHRKKEKQKELKEQNNIKNEIKRSICSKINEMNKRNQELEEEFISMRNKKNMTSHYNAYLVSCLILFLFLCLGFIKINLGGTLHNIKDNDKVDLFLTENIVKCTKNPHYCKMIYQRSYKSIVRKRYLSKIDKDFLKLHLLALNIELQQIKRKNNSSLVLKNNALKKLGMTKESCYSRRKIMTEKIQDLNKENHQIAEKLVKFNRNIQSENASTFRSIEQIKHELNIVNRTCNEQITDLKEKVNIAFNESQILAKNFTEFSKEHHKAEKQFKSMVEDKQKSVDSCKSAVYRWCRRNGF